LDRPAPVTEANTKGFEPLLARLSDMLDLTRLGPRTIDRLTAAGELHPRDILMGRTPLREVETIRRWIDDLPRKGGAL
jgi:hypothetical protein